VPNSLYTMLRKQSPEALVETIYDQLSVRPGGFNWFGELYAFLFGYLGMLYLIQEWKLLKANTNDVPLQILSFPVMDRIIRENKLCVDGRSFAVQDPEMLIKTSVMREMVFGITDGTLEYNHEAKPGCQSEAFIELYSQAIAPLRQFVAKP